MAENKIDFKTLAAFPEYLEANEKLTALKITRDDVERELQAKLAKGHRAVGANALDTMAQELIGGMNADKLQDPGDVLDRQRKDDLARLTQKRSVLDRAIELQRQEVENLRANASRAICDEVRPAYRKLVKDIALRSVALARLLEQESALRDELHQAGVMHASFLSPLPLGLNIGKLSDGYSRINIFLKALVDDNYLSPADLEVLK